MGWIEMMFRVAVLAGFALLAVAFAAFGEGGGGGGPRKPNVVEGLELTEPQTRTRPGLVKIAAKVAAPKDAKVKIVWDVEAQFEDADVTLEWEPRDSGRAIQVVVSDSRGVIRVCALAVIDGEPTQMAKTFIDVDYRPRQQPRKEDPESPPPQPAKQPTKHEAKEQVKGKVVKAYFLLDTIDGDENVNAMLTSQRTKNKLREAGVEGVLVGTDSANYVTNYKKYADDVGGPPCVLWVTEARKVRKASKIAPDAKIEDLLKEANER